MSDRATATAGDDWRVRMAEGVQRIIDHAPLGTVVTYGTDANGNRCVYLTYYGENYRGVAAGAEGAK